MKKRMNLFNDNTIPTLPDKIVCRETDFSKVTRDIVVAGPIAINLTQVATFLVGIIFGTNYFTIWRGDCHVAHLIGSCIAYRDAPRSDTSIFFVWWKPRLI